jgi:hypothetical protein
VDDRQAIKGMTVNERLAHFELFPAFDAAVRARDKPGMLDVLMKAGFSREQAEYTAPTVLKNREHYGHDG